MKLWHLTPDSAPVRGGKPVVVRAGSWPVEPGQRVWVNYVTDSQAGRRTSAEVEATWV